MRLPWPSLLFVGFLAALVIALLLTALLIRLAPRLGLIDLPSARKVHTTPTPKGGGLAIVCAWLIVSGLFSPEEGRCPLLIALVGVVLIGLIDDWRPLPWQLRLGVQTAAAILAVGWLNQFGGWLGYGVMIFVPWPVAVFWVVALTNAFNMLDNMDALSAGVAWITAGMFAAVVLLRPEIFAHVTGERIKVFYCIALMGALTGFLWFNFSPARIFMGDCGSTFLGFYFGIRSLQLGCTDFDALPDWDVMLCMLTIPLYDLVSVVSIRLDQGRSPFHADKQHLSHRLVQLGLTPVWAVRTIYLLALVSGVVGLALDHLRWIPRERRAGIVLCGWVVLAVVEYFLHWRRRRASASV